LVTFAVTIPNVKIYSEGCISKISCVDFCDIMKAGITTKENGIIGDKTLVPLRKIKGI
jgi:hypothetical protein